MTEAALPQSSLFRWLWFLSLAGGISFASVALVPKARTNTKAQTQAHARVLARSLAVASVNGGKVDAAQTQRWLDGTQQKLREIAPFAEAMVLVERQKGMFAFMRETRALAHSNPKRRGKPLKKDSDKDKELFDLTQGLDKKSQKDRHVVKIVSLPKSKQYLAAAPLLSTSGKHLGNAIVRVPYIKAATSPRRSPMAAYGIGWLIASLIVGGLLFFVRGSWGHLIVLLGLMGASLYPYVDAVERKQQARISKYQQQQKLLQHALHLVPPTSQLHKAPGKTDAWLRATLPSLDVGILRIQTKPKIAVVLARNKLQAQPATVSARRYVGLGCLAILLYALYAFGIVSLVLQTFLQHRAAYLYTLPAMGGMLLLVFLPFAVGIGLSFFQHTGGGEYSYVGLKHFREILVGQLHPFPSPLSFYFTLTVTILWTVLNVALHVSIGLALALLLKNPLLRMKEVYRVLLILPWAIPNYITALIWKGMFHQQFGAINALRESIGLSKVQWFSEFSTAFTANLVTNTWLGFPFMMVVALGALQSIPNDLYEAADVDGANAWQKFVHITLPLLKPALFPAIILGSIWTFNMFNVIYLVSGGGPENSTDILLTEAYHWAFTRGNHYGYAAAYSVIIFIILLGYSMATNRITKASEGIFQD